ncbi:MAG: flagellar protein [Elusimicrobia bacterium HGW-Elusimicrobia-1]|jgi:flagellar protein FlbD|nr:MAG: flagellar protein [Elusimicrobia bacterium HGW-Elusimicrobia-1]
MIILHRLNGQAVTINAELIESVESMPDTKVVLISNNQYLVKESPTEIVEKVVEYKRKITGNPPVPPL